MKLSRFILIFLILPALAGVPAFALQPGDRGYGLTVFSGNQIERFAVEVLGQVQNNQLNEEELRSSGKSWLIRVSGEEIESRGGISQGMSGSPVYIDGQLVGAVSSSWTVTDHLVGLMTPIAEMRELYERQSRRRPREGAPRSSPIFVSGLAESNRRGLQRLFQSQGYRVVGSAAADENCEKIPLVPGQAIAIVLARGDVNIFTIGTLTDIRPDGRLLALGHAFMKRGDVDWFLAPARIHHTFASAEASFKMGVPLAPCGIVQQDRNAGVMGRMGVLPRVTHLSIRVTDEKEKRQGSLQTTVVRDRLLLTEVAVAGLMQAIDRVADRELDETVHLVLSASLRDGQGDTWRCERSTRGGFDDPRGFLQEEIVRFVGGLLDNPQQEILVDDLCLQLIIDDGRRRQAIVEATLDAPPVLGENAVVRLRLERYRGKDLELAAILPIPVNLADGEYEIHVEAGDAADSGPETPRSSPLGGASNGRAKQTNFATYLDHLAEENRGDRIRIRLLPKERRQPEAVEHPALEHFIKHRPLLTELARRTDERRRHPDGLSETILPVDLPTVGSQTITVAFGDVPTAATGDKEEVLP